MEFLLLCGSPNADYYTELHLILTIINTQLHCQFFTVTDTSGIAAHYPPGRFWPANEIAALLLECSSHYAVTVCPVSCELHFLSRQAIVCPPVLFIYLLLFPVFVV